MAIENHKLTKDSMGGYRYNHAVTSIEHIRDVLEVKYYDAAANGMKGLISAVDNELAGFKANTTTTRAEVKNMLLEVAALISSTTAAEITSYEGTQEEANRQNIFRLAFIGANEGIVKEMTARVGINIMHPILYQPDGGRMKKVAEYLFHQLM